MKGVKKRNRQLRHAPWIVLTICLALVIAAFLATRRYQKDALVFELKREAEILQDRIQERFHTYEDALYGGRSFISATQSVTRAEWKQFVSTLNINNRYPGIRGLGYIRQVENLAAFEAEARTQFDSSYSVWPESDFPQKQVIYYLEPEDENSRALGFDMTSENVRRKALFAARDSGKTQITPRLNLIQDEVKMPAFLVFVPVYDESMPRDSIDQRRSAYRGAVYGFFHVEAFFKTASANLNHPFDFRIFDSGDKAQGRSLLYQNSDRAFHPTSQFTQETVLNIFGQPWYLQWSLRDNVLGSSWEDELVLIIGLLFSALVFGLMRNLLYTRNKSLALAEGMTVEVRSYSAFQTAILNSARYMIITSDRNNIIQHMNLAAEAALGVKAADVIGKVSAGSLVAPEYLAAHKSEIESDWILLSQDRDPAHPDDINALERELTYVRRDGTRFPARLQLTSMRDAEGHVTGYVGISLDISEEKEIQRMKELTEAKLLSSEQKFKTFMDYSPALVTIKDREGRLIYMNRRVAERFGVEAESWIGKTVTDINPPEMAALKNATEKKVREDGKVSQEYLTQTDKEGRDAHFFVLRFPLSQDGQGELGTISIDVTEQKAAEQKLSAALIEAQQANVLKSQFLANMSHEIRTPMNGIIGMTEMLLQTSLLPEQREYMNIVQKSADSLLGIINDILDFSKVDSGKMQLEAVAFDLEETLNAAVKPLAIMAEEKGLRLNCVLDPEARVVLKGDPLRLTQVLINLLGNAIKFTISGDIKLTVARMPAEADGGRTRGLDGQSICRLHFAVRDNGIGIPVEKLGRIFEAFTQADGSMTRTFGGSGLGLTISSRLVALMGGEIKVTSEVDKGSEFSFTIELPEAQRSKVVTLVPEQKPQRDLSETHVLLTEDNVINQTLAVRILERRKCKVTIANNGMEAVDAYLRGGFDIILMDIQMPVMTGLEATQRIRSLEQSRHARHIPIVAMTAHAMQGDRERFLQVGMDDYISKPIRVDELFAIVERLTEGNMTNAKGTSLVNEKKILEDLADDWDLIREVGNLFLQTADATLADLKKAVDSKDAKNIEHHAHKFKGAVAIFGAEEVVELAQTIEDLGENGNIAMVPELFTKLLARSLDFRAELQIFLKQRSAA